MLEIVVENVDLGRYNLVGVVSARCWYVFRRLNGDDWGWQKCEGWKYRSANTNGCSSDKLKQAQWFAAV